jgi:hypothetical protein
MNEDDMEIIILDYLEQSHKAIVAAMM